MQKKKLLGSALALAMVFPSSQASAEMYKNLKWHGQMDFAGVSADNVTDLAEGANPAPAAADNRDRIGSMQHRFIVGATADLLDDVHGEATLVKNNRVYGNTAENLNGVQTAIEVQEANVKIDKLAGAVDLTLGRTFWGNPGDLVAYFGPRNDYGLTVDALDAVVAEWAGEMANVTAIFGKLQGNTGTLTAAQNGDTDVRALIAGLKGHENVAASAYLWNALTRRYNAGVGIAPTTANAGGRNQRLFVAGVKGKLSMGGLWVGGEFAKNFGDQRQTETGTTAGSRKFTGWAFLADAGAKVDLDGVGAFTPWGHFAIGTGDDNTRDNENKGFQAINSDYRQGALYGRFHSGTAAGFGSAAASGASALATQSGQGLQNRVVTGIGVKVTPAAVSKLTVGLSGWDFRQHRDTSNGTTQAFRGEKRIGRELDLEATWMHSDNVSVTGTLARFYPGSAIHEAAQSTNATAGSANSGQPVNAASMAALDIKIKWGGQ